MSVEVIVGLGNPGAKYRNTRHNIGFVLIEALASASGASWRTSVRLECETSAIVFGDRRIILAKPLTYVNRSGRAVGAVLRYHKLTPENLLALHDDITMETGRVKLTAGGNSGGHNGVEDLIARVGGGFARYRLGVGAKPRREMDLADHVLSRFTEDENKLLTENMPYYMNHLRLIIDNGIESAMNSINQRTAPK
ncbi:MAG: aminoacyl-tRNA hydrolase [Opitutales bacterium]